MDYQSIRYEVSDRIATINLNRPERLNAIDEPIPGEIREAVESADQDPRVHVVILTGAGRAFCAGYDLSEFAARAEDPHTQEMPWDPTVDYRMMNRNTQDFVSLRRCSKPTIAKVHGYAVAGGSDIALACDLVVMAADAEIGYPPARVWGVPTTAMWVYPDRRRRGEADRVGGRRRPRSSPRHQSGRVGRPDRGHSPQPVDDEQDDGQPALESMGLAGTQMLATLFDGIARHSPEGLWFKRRAEQVGFAQAVRERDSGDPIAPDVSR